MTRRLSVDWAVGLLEGELGSGRRTLDDLVREDLWLAFLRFVLLGVSFRSSLARPWVAEPGRGLLASVPSPGAAW